MRVDDHMPLERHSDPAGPRNPGHIKLREYYDNSIEKAKTVERVKRFVKRRSREHIMVARKIYGSYVEAVDYLDWPVLLTGSL